MLLGVELVALDAPDVLGVSGTQWTRGGSTISPTGSGHPRARLKAAESTIGGSMPGKTKTAQIEVHDSAGNVFEDMGMRDAEERLAKAELVL